MSYSTGNEERDRLLQAAIAKVVGLGKTPNLKLVGRALPEDFSLDQDELSGMLADMAMPDAPLVSQVEGTPLEPAASTASPVEALPKSLDKIGLLHALDDETPHQDAADEPTEPEIDEPTARAILVHAQKRLDKARANMVIATERLKFLRGDLASAIYQWQLLFKPVTQTREALMREHIAANQQYKQDVIDGKVPPRQMPRRGKSVIDRSNGFYGDGNDFARRSERTTAGIPAGVQVLKGYRRSALPSQFLGRTIKPPSDR